jgi:hypothetical protein
MSKKFIPMRNFPTERARAAAGRGLNSRRRRKMLRGMPYGLWDGNLNTEPRQQRRAA